MLVLKIFLTCFFLKGSIGTTLSTNPSIIIVGSGASGIAAATRLLKNNFTNIKVLEAENRIGGRISSVKLGDAYVDLGAEFCHGEEGNIVYSMVKDLGILRPSNSNCKFRISNGYPIKKEINEKILEFGEALAAGDLNNGCENVSSVGECLEIQIKTLHDTIEDPIDKHILSNSTLDWTKSHLSSWDSALDLNDLRITSEFIVSKGDLGLTWNGLGYKTILEVMMQKYPNKDEQLPIDDKIILQKEVENISNWQNGEKLLVTTTDGITYHADHVIFTPSVGVLKANYKTLFSPSLPDEKINAIENIGYGAIMKVLMHFSERWWKEDACWPLLWTAEDKQNLKKKNLEWLITVAALVQAENNPNVIVTWYAGSYIPLMESLSDDEILAGQMHLVNTFLASQFNVTMPNKMIRTFWYSNPHFRGTYAYESVKGHSTGGNKLPDKLAKPLRNRHEIPTVLFAGEATNLIHYSTVHGAIETGYREAERLIDLYQNVSSSA